MVRRKVKIAFIENAAKRKETFRRKKNTLLKKLEEISILCGISVCMVMYSHDNPEPEMWPPSYSEVEELISKFRSMSPMDRGRKMVDEKTHANQRIKKLKQNLENLRRKNREKEVEYVNQLYSGGENPKQFSADDVDEMVSALKEDLKRCKNRIEFLNKQELPQPLMDATPSTMETTSGEGTKDPVMPSENLPISDPQDSPPFLWTADMLTPPDYLEFGRTEEEARLLEGNFNDDDQGPDFSLL